MAEHESGQERTESATPKRIEEARKRGQVPRSRDLNAAAVTLFSVGAISVFGEKLASGMADAMRAGLSFKGSATLDAQQMFGALRAGVFQSAMAVLPVMAAGFIAAILAPMSISGWNFSAEALTPKFDRLNPANGIAKMLSSTSWVELAKSMLKFILVAVIAVMLLQHDAPILYKIGHQSLGSAMASSAQLITDAFLILASGMLIIAGVDVPWQLWQYHKQLKMSRQEIREEQKESDGSPEVKGKIRRLQQEVARRRMMEQVPKADVVITNPTHYAVALRYEESRNRAPVVVAKGVDNIAARIREIATANKVPLFEAPPLARTLYKVVDLNQEIPATLYSAVAQVLTYIYQLRAYSPGRTLKPQRPEIHVDEVST